MVSGAEHESSGRRQLQQQLTRAIVESRAPGSGPDANAEQSPPPHIRALPSRRAFFILQRLALHVALDLGTRSASPYRSFR